MNEVEKLAFFIRKSNMHLTTIVKKSGVSRPHLYKILNNEISTTTVDTIQKICNAINVNVNEIINIESKNNNDEKDDISSLSNEQKANLYLIKQLNTSNNLIANGYLLRLFQEQQNQNK